MASFHVLFLLLPFFTLSWSQNTFAGNVNTHTQPRAASTSMTTFMSSSLQKRVVTSFCDGNARNFFCIFPETCFTGIDGYIGCCTSASSCAARTCIDFTAGFSPSCDYFTGGCFYCSKAQSPYCGAVTNVLASQYAPYCGTDTSYSTMNYVNPITIGSIASFPGSAGPSPASGTLLMPQSTTRTSLPSVSPGPYTSASNTAIPGGSSVDDAQSASSTTSQQLTTTTGSTRTAQSSSAAPAAAPISSPRAIAGTVIGCAVGIVLILALMYFLKKQLARRSTPSTATIYEHKENYSKKAEDDGYTREAEPAELADDSVESNVVRQQRTSYHCVNSDPLPAGQRARDLYDMSSPVSGVVEAPTDRPLHSAPVSPAATSTSSTYLPSPNSNSPATPTTLDRGEPLTYHPPHAHPLANTSPGPRKYVPYTPSVYTSSGQAPSSLPRGAQAPTMAQSYSVAELHGESSPHGPQSMSQGLDISMSGERPWQYLSAEDALAGGWRDEGRSAHDKQ